MTLKVVRYPGTGPIFDGHVAYLVRGKEVIFTFHCEGPWHEHTSTINAAEGIVQAICQAERLQCYQHTFYDLQTKLGYPEQPHGWFSLDKLIFRGEDRITDVDWATVAASKNAHDPIEPNMACPEGVLEHFRSYIR